MGRECDTHNTPESLPTSKRDTCIVYLVVCLISMYSSTPSNKLGGHKVKCAENSRDELLGPLSRYREHFNEIP